MKLINMLRWLCCVVCLWANYSIAQFPVECPLTKQGVEAKNISESLKTLTITPPENCKIELESVIAQAKELAKTDDAQIDILKSIQDGDTLTSIQVANLQAQIDGLTRSIGVMANSFNPNNDDCYNVSFLTSLSDFFQSMAGVASVINSGYAVPMTIGFSFLSSIIGAVDKIFTKDNYGFNDKDPQIAGKNRINFLNRICSFNDIYMRQERAKRLGNTREQDCQFFKEIIKKSQPFSCYDQYLNLGNEQIKQLQQIADTIKQHLDRYSKAGEEANVVELCDSITSIFNPPEGGNPLDNIHLFYNNLGEEMKRINQDPKYLSAASSYLSRLKETLAKINCQETNLETPSKDEQPTNQEAPNKVEQATDQKVKQESENEQFKTNIEASVKDIKKYLKLYRDNSSQFMKYARQARSKILNEKWSNQQISDLIKNQEDSKNTIEEFIKEELGDDWETELEKMANKNKTTQDVSPLDKARIVHNILQRRILKIEDALALKASKDNTAEGVEATITLQLQKTQKHLITNQSTNYLRALNSDITPINKIKGVKVKDNKDAKAKSSSKTPNIYNPTSRERKELKKMTDDYLNNNLSYTSFLAKIEFCRYLWDNDIEIGFADELVRNCTTAYQEYEKRCRFVHSETKEGLTPAREKACKDQANSIREAYEDYNEYHERINKKYKNPCVLGNDKKQ